MTDVVMITVDSLRADHLGCYGYERDTTTNLDEMARSSHIFENAFSHAGTTRTSFPTILTSTYPLMYGGFRQLSPERTLVSEVLEKSGYRCGGFHSNPYLSAEFGYAHGFDTFFDAKKSPSIITKLRDLVAKNLDSSDVLFRILKAAFETTEKHAGVEVGSAYVDAKTLTDAALEWISTVNPDEPLFLWVHYMDVHHPYCPPEEHQRAFLDRPARERLAIQLRRKMLESPDEVTDEERNTLVDLYDAEIRFVDAQISRLLKGIPDRSDRNQLTLITADHGEEFGEHGGFSHNTVHDEGIHVPLILDDGSPGSRHDDLVGLIDVAPTILDYTGVQIPENYRGNSLRELVNDGDWGRNYIVGNWGDVEDRRFFYRDEDWKYIRIGDDEALYDLGADPTETIDVLNENATVAERIRATVSEHDTAIDLTHRVISEPDIDEDVQHRLEMLGYRE